MKMLIKRVYCPFCRKLVRAREEASGHNTLIMCTQCGRQLYDWNGIRFKPSTEKVALT
jgi:RNase P subunit RPR2